MQDMFETPVERAIREAQERGEFDNLPGAGKPLDLRDADDPQWWVKRWARRENLDLGGALTPAIALRKEASGFPESLGELHTEEAVRRVLEDFNRRVKLDRLRPALGPHSPIIAPTVDVEEMVARWAALRGGVGASGCQSAPDAGAGLSAVRAGAAGSATKVNFLSRIVRMVTRG